MTNRVAAKIVEKIQTPQVVDPLGQMNTEDTNLSYVQPSLPMPKIIEPPPPPVQKPLMVPVAISVDEP